MLPKIPRRNCGNFHQSKLSGKLCRLIKSWRALFCIRDRSNTNKMERQIDQHKAMATQCDLSSEFFCIDAKLLCEFESDKICSLSEKS